MERLGLQMKTILLTIQVQHERTILMVYWMIYGSMIVQFLCLKREYYIHWVTGMGILMGTVFTILRKKVWGPTLFSLTQTVMG